MPELDSGGRLERTMANAIEKAVLELTEELAEKQGVYVVDVSYKKENGDEKENR